MGTTQHNELPVCAPLERPGHERKRGAFTQAGFGPSIEWVLADRIVRFFGETDRIVSMMTLRDCSWSLRDHLGAV